MSLFGSRKPDIETLTIAKDINGLIKALNYQQNDSIRLRSAKALGVLGDLHAVVPLCAALKDSDKYNRGTAAIFLGERAGLLK